jgi:hypothetical protein
MVDTGVWHTQAENTETKRLVDCDAHTKNNYGDVGSDSSGITIDSMSLTSTENANDMDSKCRTEESFRQLQLLLRDNSFRFFFIKCFVIVSIVNCFVTISIVTLLVTGLEGKCEQRLEALSNVATRRKSKRNVKSVTRR